MAEVSFFLKDEVEQLSLGSSIADRTPPGSVIFLQGELGAGKTTLVRGFLQSLGFDGNVKSPTYTLLEPYLIDNQQIYHFDLYRLGTPDELEYAGGRDYFDGESICLVEWPEKAEGYLPEADIICSLNYQQRSGIQGRCCEISAQTDKGCSIIRSLSN
ncbi:MAG TPA: tRNA (adenosine(37)-N6)-threonylcarbamoyltransferase complex ATPase subunit type 1 TsaE [Gammaproteobacteria bacterium]|nr:tRNA (adenosine(37)-N6)-threonylcarbamoyltransferase complex ATPase subunit type 1 TsaE [Gammaproteobacteria bacterium]